MEISVITVVGVLSPFIVELFTTVDVSTGSNVVDAAVINVARFSVLEADEVIVALLVVVLGVKAVKDS